MIKILACCAATAVVAIGCSGDDSEPTSAAPTTDGDAPASTSTAPAAATASTVPTDEPAEASVPYRVSLDVAVDSVGVDGDLEVVIEPDDIDEIDPFVRFGSCSGLRASVGAYAVTAVDTGAAGDVRSVAAVTDDHVGDAGIYDARIRVEIAERAPVTAVGTVTLDEGLRSGSFIGFEPNGETVEGTFECDGPGDVAVPIGEATADAGTLASVEVVALLRVGDAERVVGLTLDTSEVELADARCPGVTGSDEPVLVSVEGGQAVGAINAFELTSAPGATLRMRVGGASYELADVDLDTDAGAAAGTFGGTTADGIEIVGAFRCT